MDNRREKIAFQREVAKVLLENLEHRGFVLTGSGALREHGLINRPTQDVDLFTRQQEASGFREATDHAIEALRDSGYSVQVHRDLDTFKDIIITRADQSVQVDFGVDYRGHDPAHMEIGAVLNMDDAVGSKVSALYSRQYPRDYLDVDAIRQSGRYTDESLLAVAESQDPGFDREYFSQILTGVKALDPDEVEPYGVEESQLRKVQQRLTDWAAELTSSRYTGLEEIRSLHRTDFPAQQKPGADKDTDPTEGRGKGPEQGRDQSGGIEL